MTVIYSDNANRPDGLEGVPWAALYLKPTMAVVSNQITSSLTDGSNSTGSYYSSGVLPANTSTKWTYKSNSGGFFVAILYARLQGSLDAPDGYSVGVFDDGSVELGRNDDGTVTVLATGSITLSADTVLELRCIDSRISLYQDNVERVFAVDTTYPAGGYAGKLIYMAGPSVFFDDWQAEDLSGVTATVNPGRAVLNLAGKTPTLLQTIPGVVLPLTAALSLQGRSLSVTQPASATVTPGKAALTLVGNSLAPNGFVSPATAALTCQGLVSTQTRHATITPALNVRYETAPDNAPTLQLIRLVSPATAGLSLAGLGLNVNDGGNIATRSPATATLTLQGRAVVEIFNPAGLGAVSLIGRAPTLLLQTVVSPGPCQILAFGRQSEVVRSFTWVDVDPQPPSPWTTTSVAA